jgi:hypothetical protein
MGFVQTAFLGALAALAVPVIVHLIFRWQTRQVELGTIRFLSEILRENARRRQLKRYLLLAMRLGCVALLAVLFARPYLLAKQAATKDRFVVVLIDQSASTSLRKEGVRLMDRAVEKAKELVRGSGQNTRWEIAFFDHAVHPFAATPVGRISNPSGDAVAGGNDQPSINDLAAPEAAYHASDFGAAMAWARDVCINAPPGRKDVYVLTDLQRSGLDWTTTEAFPQDVTLHVEDLGKPLANNVAITNAVASRSVVRPDDGVSIDVTVFNFGPFPQDEVPVTLTLTSGNRTHRLQDTAALGPGKASQLTFEAPGLSEGLWTGVVRIDVEDELAFDNQRHVAVLAAPQQRVLLVDGADVPARALSETFYLDAALRLASPGETLADGPFVPRVARLADAGLPALDAVDLLVLANVGDLSPAEATRVAEFVQNGGGLLVFTGEQVTADSCRTLAAAGLTPGAILGIARARDLPFRWQAWEDALPMFDPFRDPQHGDLRRLAFDAYTQIEPAADTKVLARFRDGGPALLEHRPGRGRVLWFTSTVSRDWGDWPRSRLFVPLVHQMLLDLAGLTGGGPIRPVTLDAARTGDDTFIPGVARQDDHWAVVNVSPRESETDRCTPEEFAARFGVPLPAESGDESAATPVAAAAGVSFDLRDDELWHWVALALLALLCGEVFLANRTSA